MNISHFFVVFQEKSDKCEPLLVRATEIQEKALGPYHPLVVIALNKRVLLLDHQVRAFRFHLLIDRFYSLHFFKPRLHLLTNRGGTAIQEGTGHL